MALTAICDHCNQRATVAYTGPLPPGWKAQEFAAVIPTERLQIILCPDGQRALMGLIKEWVAQSSVSTGLVPYDVAMGARLRFRAVTANGFDNVEVLSDDDSEEPSR